MMKKRIFSLLLCAVMFAAALPFASAQVLEDVNIADEGSLPAALHANDRAAVLKALEGELSGSGVIVDLLTFNAVIVTPAEKFPDMYGAMPDCENRVIIGLYENENADRKTALEKDTRSFYFAPPAGAYKSGCTLAVSADLRNLSLPEREAQETDALLDSALFVRERGFYDVNGNVCSGCGEYTLNPGEHSVLACGVHMSCVYDKNDVAHYAVCRECGRMACACYCNNALSSPVCIAVTGSGDFAVAGSFHEKLVLSFDDDAKVQYIGFDEQPKTVTPQISAAPAETQETADAQEKAINLRPEAELTPEVECAVCGKTLTIPKGFSFNCGAHYSCPGCEKTLKGEALSAHQSDLECGHYACDGRKHSTEIFSENCPYEPKHHKCENVEGIHGCPACGKYYPCEEGLLHSGCYVCGMPLCTGNHEDCDYCGGRWCDGRYHGPGSCT